MACDITIKRSGLQWLDELRADIAKEGDFREGAPTSPRTDLLMCMVRFRGEMDFDLEEAIDKFIAYVDELHGRIYQDSLTSEWVAPPESWPTVNVRMVDP